MKSQDLLHKNIRISGRVQGVGFRYSAKQVASSLGISGFIRNLPNGDVYLEIEGMTRQVEEFINWCHQGPQRAVIKSVDIVDGMLMRFEEFEVRGG
jgi:acylphosphatase